MSLPDGRNWEEKVPAFSAMEEFLNCDRFITHSGNETATKVVEWSQYRPSHPQTDIFSLLAPTDLDATVNLPEVDYRIFTLVEQREPVFRRDEFSLGDTYFSFVSNEDLVPDRWEYLSFFGSDTYNMALSDPLTRESLAEFIDRTSAETYQSSHDHYNSLPDLLAGDENARPILRDHGFSFGTKDAAGSIAAFPTSKIATMFVGLRGDRQVALQARWL